MQITADINNILKTIQRDYFSYKYSFKPSFSLVVTKQKCC